MEKVYCDSFWKKHFSSAVIAIFEGIQKIIAFEKKVKYVGLGV